MTDSPCRLLSGFFAFKRGKPPGQAFHRVPLPRKEQGNGVRNKNMACVCGQISVIPGFLKLFNFSKNPEVTE